MSDAIRGTSAHGAAGEPPSNAAAQSGQLGVRVENSSITAAFYANFCCLTSGHEELTIDLGLGTEPFGWPTNPVIVTQRIATNYFTAKRLLHALSQCTAARAGVWVLETGREQANSKPGCT